MANNKKTNSIPIAEKPPLPKVVRHKTDLMYFKLNKYRNSIKEENNTIYSKK